ncbi:hypothetical protein V7138_19405 [Bacillus sp. JJ1533]|uniref:hypothetical protein n=1 Tax=Bacillus sp. JJ1533 TaxID=3122959 RepID=UPI002FFF4B9D
MKGLIIIQFRYSGFFVSLIGLLFLTACGTSIYEELGVDGENVPSFKVVDRIENKRFVQLNFVTEGSGEEDAKQSIADSFESLKEEYNGVAIEMTDKDGEDWYGVFIKNKNFIDDLEHRADSEDLTEGEKKLKSLNDSYENPQYPIIEFSIESILD